jgi:hypothetical protein
VNSRTRNAIAIGAFVASFMPTAHAAEGLREVHGSADAFALPGMALAWSVLRGATDDAALVVIRLVTDPALFSDVAVTGSDPFTARQQSLLALTPAAGGVELRVPRAHFAAFPRTELKFHAPGSTLPSQAPSLLVFYLGVPDTTPEFVDAAKLDAYLRARIAQVRGNPLP